MPEFPALKVLANRILLYNAPSFGSCRWPTNLCSGHQLPFLGMDIEGPTRIVGVDYDPLAAPFLAPHVASKDEVAIKDRGSAVKGYFIPCQSLHSVSIMN